MSACEKISSSVGVGRPSYFSSVVSSPPLPYLTICAHPRRACLLARLFDLPNWKMERKRKWTLKLYKPNISYFVQQHNTDLPDCKNEKKKIVSHLFAFMKQKFKTKNVQFQNIFILPLPPTEGNGISWGWRSVRPKTLKKCKKLGNWNSCGVGS